MSRFGWAGFIRFFAGLGLLALLAAAAFDAAQAQRSMMAGPGMGTSVDRPGIKPGTGTGNRVGGMGPGVAVDKSKDCPRGQAMSRGHCCAKGAAWNGKACGTREAATCPPGTKGKPPKCRPVTSGQPDNPSSRHNPPVIVDRTPDVPPRLTAIPPVRVPPSLDGAALPPATQPEGQTATPGDAGAPLFRQAEVVVMVRAGEPDSVAAQLAQAFNLNLQETVSLGLLAGARIYRFAIPDNRSVTGLAAAMSATPNVAIVSPNYYHRLQDDAAKPPKQARDLQYALPKLHVPDARALVSGRGITVAVIDSGVDAAHPALKNANLTLLDAVEDNAHVPDKHGTAITGIIAAQGGEVTGIAPGARILAVRAFAPEKQGAPPVTTSVNLARAVDMAFEKGARIFNMSFAGPHDPLLIAMIDAAYAEGAIFVAAAGNNGPDGPPAFPAAYEKVIAITATDEGDRLYPHANRGRYVTAAAPGVDILVPVTGHGFDYLSGTSFAAAHVSGIIALIMERNPSLTADAVRHVLTEGARDLGEKGLDQNFGAGLADAYASLMLAGRK